MATHSSVLAWKIPRTAEPGALLSVGSHRVGHDRSYLAAAAACGPIDGETVETVSGFIFLGSKITADGDCSHEIKRRLLLGRKVMTTRQTFVGKVMSLLLNTLSRLVHNFLSKE